jgi:hypothetical protein
MMTRYKFDLRFIRLPDGVDVPDNFSLRCIGTELPKREANAADPVNIHGFKISQPDDETASGDLPVTMFETEDMATFRMIESWRSLNGDLQTGVQAPRSRVMADFRLDLLNRQKLAVWTFDLFDCFIIDNDLGSLDATDNTAKMTDINVTLRYQNFSSRPA